MSFEFIPQKIKDIILIKPKIHNDNRGFFIESYKKSEFAENGINVDFVQDNHSKSTYKVLRGLHYQVKPYEQAKLVRCIKGKILDIALDLREDSPTYKQYCKVELSEDNKQMLYIPEGFAHGFVVLSKDAEIVYKVNKEFCEEAERGIYWADKNYNINWGLDFTPILSQKDEQWRKNG